LASPQPSPKEREAGEALGTNSFPTPPSPLERAGVRPISISL